MPMHEMIAGPMREELSRNGLQELRTPEEVDAVLGRGEGTVLVAINSVCGCAATRARPAVVQALRTAAARPDQAVTVFAGQDLEATARAREYFTGEPPSSPSFALLRDGKLVYMMHRQLIETRRPEQIAGDLEEALNRHCGPREADAAG
jgi:putative YphP/YqiW family bacilliredoxin